MSRTRITVSLLVIGLVLGLGVYLVLPKKHARAYGTKTIHTAGRNLVATSLSSTATTILPENTVPYSGPITNIFFHSLVVYPHIADASSHSTMIKNNMITVAQFETILQQLYADNFVLYDPRLLYTTDAQGHIHPSPLFVPKGKKPLILSIDDLNYYPWMRDAGFADKLVLKNGVIETEVLQPSGTTTDTTNGDVVPILDSFVAAHPDFSYDGIKGVINETGFAGVLGYRTQMQGPSGDAARAQVQPVIAALKSDGWLFANHSYSHSLLFLTKNITLSQLASDISLWKAQVQPLVGTTSIFVGPFGQIFSERDPRRALLVSSGYTLLYGVGIDGYQRYFPTHLVMDRIDIDGYRINHNAAFLRSKLGISL